MKLISHLDADERSRVVTVLALIDEPDAATEVHDVLLDGEVWAADLCGLIRAACGDPSRLAVAPSPRGTVAGLRLTGPVTDPSKIVAAPVNYRDHQAEMNEDTHIDGLGIFLKAPSSVIGHGGVVRLPYDDRRFDQEGELALVVGRTARHVPPEQALDHVFGYTCLLDITMRGGEDRSTRKSFDSFSPMGPWLVTPDEVGDPSKLHLSTTVSGAVRQDADVADLIWGIPALLSYASSVMTLHPGDVITSGTPAGIGQLHGGDDVCVSISRIGSLRVSVDDQAAVHCPTRGAGRGPVPPPTPPTRS